MARPKKYTEEERIAAKKLSSKKANQKAKDNNPNYFSDYYKNNKKEISEQQKSHRILNPFKDMASAANIEKSRKNYNVVGKITQEELKELYNKQEGVCPITGLFFEPKDLSPDHIIPISNKGLNDISNIQLVFWRYNQWKSDSSAKEALDDLYCFLGFNNLNFSQVKPVKYPITSCVSGCNNILKRYPNLKRIKNEDLEYLFLNVQHEICPVYKKKLGIEQMSLDHIVPVSNKGTNDLSNLRFVYWRYNLWKSTCSEQESIDDLRMITKSIENNNIF